MWLLWCGQKYAGAALAIRLPVWQSPNQVQASPMVCGWRLCAWLGCCQATSDGSKAKAANHHGVPEVIPSFATDTKNLGIHDLDWCTHKSKNSKCLSKTRVKLSSVVSIHTCRSWKRCMMMSLHGLDEIIRFQAAGADVGVFESGLIIACSSREIPQIQ